MAKIKIGNRYFESVTGIVVADDSGDKSLYSKPSWSENNQVKAGYIEGRPFYHKHIEEGSAERKSDTPTYDFTMGDTSVSFSLQEETFNLQDPYSMIGVSIQVETDGPFYEIKSYAKSTYELLQYSESTEKIGVVVDGPAINLPSAITALVLVGQSTSMLVCMYVDTVGLVDGNNSPIGFYVNNNLPATWYYKNYFPIIIDERYRSFFQHMRSPLYIMSSSLTSITDLDFSNFAPGDIIFGVVEQ